jgi:hypothetical protein
MSNLDHILTHIEADAPCSLFHVAVWADEQLSINAVGFMSVINTLVSANAISISSDEHGLVVELV